MIFKNSYKVFGIFVVFGLLVGSEVINNIRQGLAQEEAIFEDIQGHWAQACIEELAKKEIVKGYYEDDTFRPNTPVSRAEFAALINQAFPKARTVEKATNFVDVPTDFWAYSAIREASQKGFLSGYIGSVFNPTVKITRVQALVALANGLRYKPDQIRVEQLRAVYNDAADIPDYAKEAIAAATENWLVVNYPNVKNLKPNQPATRAEVATFICQAITESHLNSFVPTQYIARLSVSELAKDLETPQPETTPTPTPQASETPQPETTPTPSPQPDRVQVQPQTTPPQPTPEPSPTPPSRRAGDVVLALSSSLPEVKTLGDIQVEFLQPETDSNSSKKLQVKITRRDEVLFEENLAFSNLQGLDARRVRSGRISNFSIVDLDRDKEPEIVIDLTFSNSQNVPFYATLIYRYSPLVKKYRIMSKGWGAFPAVLQTQQDSIVFNSYDQRFSEAFNAYNTAELPLQIFAYQGGEIVDVTQDYPDAVEVHLDEISQELKKRQRLKQDLKSVLAAYVAQKARLGEESDAWQEVKTIYQQPDAEEFIQKLRQFLQETGYLDNN